MNTRDEFSKETKEVLAKRVAYKCSNPKCHAITSGPQTEPDRAINVGVAAHITAAAQGGPRYDGRLTQEERTSVNNGIWLCQNCAKKADNDPIAFSVEILKKWKHDAEQQALSCVGIANAVPSSSGSDIVIDPEIMTFQRASVKASFAAMNLSEKYILSAHNSARRPIYNVWIELSPDHVRPEDIVINAKPKHGADIVPGLRNRADTFSLIVRDVEGKVSILIAISRIAHNETFEYEVYCNDRILLEEPCSLRTNLLNWSNEAIPTRRKIDNNKGMILFPATIPKTGTITGITLFPEN